MMSNWRYVNIYQRWDRNSYVSVEKLPSVGMVISMSEDETVEIYQERISSTLLSWYSSFFFSFMKYSLNVPKQIARYNLVNSEIF